MTPEIKALRRYLRKRAKANEAEFERHLAGSSARSSCSLCTEFQGHAAEIEAVFNFTEAQRKGQK